jgi:histidyl-tRNA synthetase
VIHGIFAELAFGSFTIKLNNRKLLRSLLESHGIAAEQHANVLHEVDRLGKMDRAEVEQRIAAISSGASAGKLLDQLTGPLSALPESEGRTELQTVYDRARSLGVPETALKIDLSIARGLDYYTGTVYETFLDGHERLGSICSGGRYDNLAEHYTKSKLQGVGISIGATRLFSQLLELGLVDTKASSIAQVLVLQVEAALAGEYARVAAELRAAGINVEVYGGDDKLGKQFKYADRAGVPLAIIYGSRERDAGIIKVKDLRASQELDVPRGEIVAKVKALLA